MHKVFISYHHSHDQSYKDRLLQLNNFYHLKYGSPIFIDRSVDTGDISENLYDEEIRQTIRDNYLRDSTVTILLVGAETKNRKHIDWELYSSMYDGKINKQSGILVVNLPIIKNCSSITAGHGEQKIVYPEITSWTSIKTRKEYETQYPYMPERIIDNLLNPQVKISVTHWYKIINSRILTFLIEATFKDRFNCKYDLGRPMKRKNFDPHHEISPLSI